MIEAFKITHDIYDSDVSLKLAYHSGFITRGNYKLLNNRFHYDPRKHYFFLHVLLTFGIVFPITLWMLILCTHNLFKARLDRFWANQDVKYDFTADLTGIGNRSVYEICETYFTYGHVT